MRASREHRTRTVHNVMLLGSALDTGGAERVIANLTRHLDKSQFNVTACHLVRPRGAIGDELVRDGYDVADVARDDRMIRRYFSFRALCRVAEARRIDVIHSHTHYALIDASLCSLAMWRRIKVVHTFHYGNYPHVPARYRFLEGFGSRVADRLVAVGIEQQKLVRSTYGLSGDRVDVVTNGVDATSAPVDPAWRERLRSSGAVVIGTICTFIEQKGLPDLLKVAVELNRAGANVLFVVVGDGVLRTQIEQQCRALDLSERVLFTGWKQAASSTMLPLFDVFFQPSLWEAMSMVVLEAMAAGKPIVATDVGDNRHVVRDGETGFIAQRSDVPTMVNALRRLVESPELRRTFGESGRRRHAEHYTVDLMTRRYERLYLDVLTRRGRENGSRAVTDSGASRLGLNGSEGTL